MTPTNGTKGDAGKMPVKTREVANAHQDSTIWNDVKLRPDDIVISTYAKSGTTVRTMRPFPPSSSTSRGMCEANRD